MKWIRETGDDPGMGIEFQFADDAAREKLHASVEKLMTESLGEQISKNLLGR